MKKSFFAFGTAVFVSAAVLVGCGGDDKPQYCSDVSTLEDSVNQLTDINLGAGAIDTFKTDLQTVEDNARAVQASAESDFPTETSDLENSVNDTVDAVQNLPSSPSAGDLAALAADASAVANSVKAFQDATSSACD